MRKILIFLFCFVVASVSSGENENRDTLSQERQLALKVQLFLDSEGFGPGRLDARWGEFTSKAAARWNEANPEKKIETSETGGPSAESVEKLEWSEPLTTEYTISEKDARSVGEVPGEPEEKAKLESLPYESLMELVGEKFHAYPEFIEELNGLEAGADLEVGQKVIVPNVASPFDLEGPKNAGDSGSSNGEISVDTTKKILEYRVDGKIVHSFPITPGAEDNPAPVGDWKVDVVAWMPEFRYDEKMLEEGERSDEGHMLPPGPNNPVGIVWMGINSDGIGIHGTSDPDSIGRSASHGCMRLSNWDAYLLGSKVAVNTKVHIQ